ncbi:hypothetical protein [Candidatus Lokiarchaeum ossiferum]|uniref:hypothetical protein n=1 Tax=Candidatus Lokiarchaeum ossiferum TaxID=2951803 RepID=UPI00352D8D52
MSQIFPETSENQPKIYERHIPKNLIRDLKLYTMRLFPMGAMNGVQYPSCNSCTCCGDVFSCLESQICLALNRVLSKKKTRIL